MLKILLMLLAVLFCGAIPRCGHTADIQDAKTQLQHWVSRIVSIRVRSLVHAEEATSRNLRLSKVKISRMEKDWVWEDSGRCLDSRVAFHDGVQAISDIRISDGKKFYSLRYPSDNPGSEFPAMMTLSPYQPGIMASSEVGFPMAVMYGAGGLWLSQRLLPVLEGTTTSDGLLEVDGQALGYEGFRVLLDPQHGYLPQMLDYVDNSAGVYRLAVDEYRELEPGFWFPWKGTDLLNGDDLQKWEVTQVDLNTDLPDSLFKPKLGDETYVYDKISGKEYWHGGKPPARLVAIAKAAAKSPPTLTENPNPETGLPEQSGNWSLWLVLVGVALVSGGVWASRRG